MHLSVVILLGRDLTDAVVWTTLGLFLHAAADIERC